MVKILGYQWKTPDLFANKEVSFNEHTLFFQEPEVHIFGNKMFLYIFERCLIKFICSI